MNNQQELLDLAGVDLSQLGCNILAKCKYKERTLSYATGIQIPTVGQDPEEVFKECCYFHYVLADLDNADNFRNDYSSFFHQRQLSNETTEFVLVHLETGDEFVMDDETYGQYFGFGFFSENINLKGYLIQWRKVMQEIGEGKFKVLKKVTIAGIDLEFPSIVFTLRKYSSKNADNTVRIDTVMNGRIEKTGIDFTNTGWKSSIRVPGFFGRRDPSYEEDNIIDKQFNKRQISMIQRNEFRFQTNLIPDCITKEILDFYVFANDIYMNDYNLNNHSYEYVKFGVKFGSNEGTEYKVTSRKAQINLIFNDKYENNLKRNFR